MSTIIELSKHTICANHGLCKCGRTKWAIYVLIKNSYTKNSKIIKYKDARWRNTFGYYCIWCHEGLVTFHYMYNEIPTVYHMKQTPSSFKLFTELLIAEYKISTNDNEKVEIMSKLLGSRIE